MKLLIAAAAAATLGAGSSFAQTQAPVAPAPEVTAPSDTVPGGETAPGDTATAPPPELDAQKDQSRMGERGDRGMNREMRWRRAMRDHDGRGGRHWRNGRDRLETGARFRIEVDQDGSLKFDVRCAANEPMRSCADLMMEIFDRLDRSGSSSDDGVLPPQQD